MAAPLKTEDLIDMIAELEAENATLREAWIPVSSWLNQL